MMRETVSSSCVSSTRVTSLPFVHGSPLINIEGPSGVGKTTLWRQTPDHEFYKLPEYATAQSLYGRRLVNPNYPTDERSFINNERYFAHLELEFWQTQAGESPLSVATLLQGKQPVLRDRGFFGAIAFSHACNVLLGWGEGRHPLGSYETLVRERFIPCPDQVIGLTAPIELLAQRLKAPNERHPVWGNVDLLHYVNDILFDLLYAVYMPMSALHVDESGEAAPCILTVVNREQSYERQREICDRLLEWRPKKRISFISTSRSVVLKEVMSIAPSQTTKIPTQRPLDQVNSCYSANPHPWRELARTYWNDALSAALMDTEKRSMPLHFEDRHAYLLYRAQRREETLGDQDLMTISPDFDQCEAKWLTEIHSKRTGVKRLGRPPLGLDHPLSTSDWLKEMLQRWRQHLRRGGVKLNNTSFISQKQTWLTLYKRSAHYPMRTPAILGPSFYDRLSVEGLERFHGETTEEMIWDHYQLLLQVHEETHLIQRGEPMLAEVMLAWQWCSFLSEHDLWYWQESSPGGEGFNRERDYVSKIKLSHTEAGLLYIDQYLGVQRTFTDPQAYDIFCEGAWLFDHKHMNYQQYLAFVVWLFAHKTDPQLSALAKQEWFSHAHHH